MNKKIYIVQLILILGVSSVLTGCSPAKNSNPTKSEEITVINPTAQKEVNEIKTSSVPNFQGIYNNTIEIDVKFDSSSMYSNKAVKIKDGKMISDILTMIGKSQLIQDESKINNMSGMAAKNNSMILVQSDKSKKEIKFAFDDAAFAFGYIQIDNNKFDPGFSFCRYIRDLTEYRQFDTNIDKASEELFKKYNWTIDYRINTINETLPSNLKYEAGEYPVKLYWAYNKELSKSIGLDYSEYLGKKVQVDIYRLREPLPDYMSPRMDSRGILVKYDNKIIGAFIDAGRHSNFACSLNRKSLADITNKEWNSWVSDYMDYNNELEIKLSKMKPEDIIKEYYAAINSHNEKLQYACMTTQNVSSYLAMNMDNNQLINGSFKDAYVLETQNTAPWKLISIKQLNIPDNKAGTLEYAVTDLKFETRYIILEKESDKIGWRIQGVGTGP
ncbi:DUF4830 domain-containing protein [Candidatus Clostridium radicumherbarum]|uniref:DUF4830 domain-containing protein n=1 Tax=Candidatus Clostridium radicumherbarum TaxID=3381662 RepID=A0ABW8TWN9_9CLOT